MVAVRRAGRRVAWIGDRRLLELHVEEADRESLVNSIYLGRILRVEKGLGAAFVEIGASRPGFLPLAEIARKPVEGSAMTVQVTRDPIGDKGARLTGRPALIGSRLVLTPGRRGVSVSERIRDAAERERLAAIARKLAASDAGLILRGAAEGASSAALADDAARLHARWRQIDMQRDSGDPPRCLHRELAADLRLLRDHGASFREIVYDERRAAETARRWCADNYPALAARVAYRRADQWVPSTAEIEDQVEAALAPEVMLASGGRLRFEVGGTLTAVDVDTAADVGGRGDADSERTLLRVNIEAAGEIARQLRLRNLGGVIVIDFIDMKPAEHRRRVVEALRQAVADDPQPCWVGTISRLGLVEMTRRRRGPALDQLLAARCAHCAGTGRAPGSLSMIFGSKG